MLAFFAFAVAAIAAAPSCHPLQENRILAQHLAEIDPRFSAMAPSTFVSYAPAPGHQRVFTPSELERFSSAVGSISPAMPICFEWKLRELSQADILAAMKSSIPGATIDIEEISRTPVPEGRIEFTRPGTGSLWRGFVHYGESGKYPIWAKARVLVPSKRVVAVQALKAGEEITAAQVKLEEGLFAPVSGNAFCESITQVVGRTTRGAVAPGTPIRASLLTAVQDIKQGDIVTVRVRSGGAMITLQAKAAASGFRGAPVRLKNEASGKMFSAVIQEQGVASVSVGEVR